MNLIRRAVCLCLVMVWCASCGDQDLGLAGDSIEMKLDEEGGSVGLCREMDDVGRCIKKGASVYVPWGSLTNGSVTIGIEALKGEPAENLLNRIPDGLEPASDIYMFTPHGTKFDKEKPVRIYIPYEGMHDEGLSVLRLDDEQDKTWEIVGVGVGTSARAFGVIFSVVGDVHLEISHFSGYLVTREVEDGATEAALKAQ